MSLSILELSSILDLSDLSLAGRSDPVEDIIEFKRKFEEQYGTWHPTMYQGTYSQVSHSFAMFQIFSLIHSLDRDHFIKD